PETIRVVNSRDLLTTSSVGFPYGGRDFYLTRTGSGSQTSVPSYGHGTIPQAKVDIASAVAMRDGRPVYVAGHPFLILFIFIIIAARLSANRSARCFIYALFGITLFIGPGLLINAGVHT